MEDEIARVVREHGWFAARVSDHDPPFLDSIGLLKTRGHPELIVFGLDPSDAHALLSAMIREIGAGRSYAQPGVSTVALAEDHRVGIRRVHPTQHPLYLGYAMGSCRYLGRIGELEAVQVFWPDSGGSFPFEVGCDLGVSGCQPRLDIALTPSEIRNSERLWESSRAKTTRSVADGLPTRGTLTESLPGWAHDAERRRRPSRAERGNEWAAVTSGGDFVSVPRVGTSFFPLKPRDPYRDGLGTTKGLSTRPVRSLG